MEEKTLIAAFVHRDKLFARANLALSASHPNWDEHASKLRNQGDCWINPSQERVRLGSMLRLAVVHPAVEKVLDAVEGAVGALGTVEWFRVLADVAWLESELRFLVDDDPVPEVAPEGYYTSLGVCYVRVRFVTNMVRLAADSQRALPARRSAFLAAIGVVLVAGDDFLRRHCVESVEPLLDLNEFAETAELGRDALDGVEVPSLTRVLRDALRVIRTADESPPSAEGAISDGPALKAPQPVELMCGPPLDQAFAQLASEVSVDLTSVGESNAVAFRNPAGHAHVVDAQWKPAPALPALIRTSGKPNHAWLLLVDLCAEGELDDDDESHYGEDARRNLNKWLRAASGARGAFVSKVRTLGNIVRNWATPHDPSS